MGNIYKIKDKDTGNLVLPVSVIDAILDNNGNRNLTTILSDILNRIENVKVDNYILISESWKFKLISSVANINYSDLNPSQKSYDDSSWSEVTIPHDWSIYNDFNSSSAATYEGGYLDGGDAWYRKVLPTTQSMKGKKIFLYFDGVYMESDIYINGVKVGINRMGYNPFYFDISSYLNYDENDLLAVFVRNRQPSSRWYSGSGIYRDAYLVTAEQINIGINDLFITTPNLSTESALGYCNTNVSIKINNSKFSGIPAKLINRIYYEGDLITEKHSEFNLDAGINNISEIIKVNNPVLWDIYNGNIYMLKTYLYIDDVFYELKETEFGYRYFNFNANTGFWLNGKNIKLNGVCMHHDLGCLGAEINRSAIERQIRILKGMGCNAIRITHNPSSTIFIDVCKKEGILLIEEMFDCWTVSKKTYDFARYFNDYAQSVIENTVNRDKNNPAIIMWSIGNEIYDTKNSDYNPILTATTLKNWIKSIDTTRPVTMGEDQKTNSVSLSVAALMDVAGFNYGDSELSNIHSNNPTWCLYGSETTSALSSRGVYTHEEANKQCSSYDDDKVSWGNYAAYSLSIYKNSPYLAGHFVWIGFDYIGEPTPFNTYPAKSSYFGIIDLAGFPKDIYYMYQSQWQSKPMIHILPHWNYASGDTKTVWLYSNCPSMELFLNGVSQGIKTQNNIESKLQFEYTIAWQSGTLMAKGYDATGNVVATDTRVTAENAAGIKLSSDKLCIKHDSDDLAFITCDIVDANGSICPLADNLVTFNVTGGSIKGVDNGNASSIERFKGVNYRKAFSGKCLCVVESDGTENDIVITASADGLTSGSITIPKFTSTILKE